MSGWSKRAARLGVLVMSAVVATAVVSGVPASAAVPSRPLGVAAVVSASNGLSVSFLPPASSGGKVVTGYRATCTSDTGGVSRTVAGASSPVRVGSLTKGARYRCTVRAVNADGAGAASIGSSFVIVPGPPSKPYGVTVSELSGPRMQLAFAEPVSDGGAPILEYQTRCVSGSTVVSTRRELPPVVTATVTDGLTFQCQVRARNANGVGAWSLPSAPVEIMGDPSRYDAVVAGAGHTCAVRTRQVRCWGGNGDGQLGLGDTAFRGDQAGEMGAALPGVDLGAGRTARAVTAGVQHTCALLDDATVKCWGGNGDGQLGLGDTTARGDQAGEMGAALPAVDLGAGRTAKAIAAGGYFTCALLDDATVKCWGANGFGQLGLGDTDSRGDAAGEMGSALPAVDLGPGRTAKAIAPGDFHVCALLDDATVKCWGMNVFGQLGLGDTTARGGAAGQMGSALPLVDLGPGRTATALSGGHFHTCALLDDSTVKCWGLNIGAQLGLGDTADRGDQAGEMGSALPVVDLGVGRTAKVLAAGGNYTCAVLDDSTVKCWGGNGDGQLGLGDTNARGGQAGEMGAALPVVDLGTGRTAKALTTGGYQSCVLLDDGTVKCWGQNTNGQLGLGDLANRGDQAGEMGDALPAVDLAT